MGRIVLFASSVGSILLLTLIYAVVATQTGGTPSASEAPSSSAAASPGAVLGEIAISAFDLGFDPGTVDVPEAGSYTVTFHNTGAIAHDLTFADGTKLTAEAGEMATATVTIPAGGTTFLCTVPGHSDAGMKGTVTVAGAAPSPSGDSHGGPPPTTDVAADPSAPPYELRDAAAPPLLSGKVHDIDLVVEEKLMTVAAGYQQMVWTFNGSVPGPVIRVKVGDRIRVHLKNPATSTLSHSVDFHASQVAWNDEMTSIKPGEEKLYEWTAAYAGVWMYHCGTAPALHHIANGMFGMVIVEPAEGLPAVDKEFAIVQSEWYLGPQGKETNLAKASAGAPAPDFVMFNGVANQYLDNPIQVGTGERVRIFLLDAGPNIDSSFHIVGTIFDTVTKEGMHLVRGNDGSWGSQAVDLSPAQGAIIEFQTAEDGKYPMVTHAFNFVGRGALGLFQSGDGDPLN
ncbi:MAG TPA: multicopper oxidase domain-containing protein [Methylomirabilota bacterium]|jgi:nitrite reductase (NO-forming)|nr:multicopper oxidase domain-containing protein [Methylomirabilota bacterium]